MCLLPGPAEDVGSKDSRMMGLFISRKKLSRAKTKAFGGRRKNRLSCIMSRQVRILRRTSPRPRNFTSSDLVY